jgi:drug/metabolite transporter (DMT)-like permease
MKLKVTRGTHYRVDAVRHALNSSQRIYAGLSCLSYASCSVLLTLANKAIFSGATLDYPWTLLGTQSLFCAVVLGLYYGMSTRRSPLKPSLLRELLVPCFIFALYIFTNARALRYISLPMLSVVKSLAPMGIALAELFLFREHVSRGTYGAMALILLSNAVSVVNDVEYNAAGYSWAAINALTNIAYVVSLRYCLSHTHSSGSKTMHMNILLTAIMFPVALCMGELGGFIREISMTSTRFRILFALSCMLAAGISASVFWVIQETSGSTLSFVGGANKVFVIILGALVFDATISFAGWVGVSLGVLASISFTATKCRASHSNGASSTTLQHSGRSLPNLDSGGGNATDKEGAYLVQDITLSASDVSNTGDDSSEGETMVFSPTYEDAAHAYPARVLGFHR